MTARHFSLGITRNNYEEVRNTLSEMMEIMRSAKFGTDGKWKPFQRGFIVTTTSVLELSDYLLKEHGFDYVLAGRLLQDCLENLFSSVRSGNPKRNALQVRDSIKQIAISEYMSQPIRNSSYQWDDSVFLSKFLTIVRSVKDENDKKNATVHENNKTDLEFDILDSNLDLSTVVISSREQNILYKIACYLLYKITVSKVKLHCEYCLSSCRLSSSDEPKSYTKLTRQPNLQYKYKFITHIKHELYSYFLQMEKFFRLVHPILSSKKTNNFGKLITNKILDLGLDCGIPNCHSLMKTLTARFVTFRLKNAGSPREKKRKMDLSSRTINL